ncbi:hypothetical protein L9G16_04970 [Shewanella sp. A25]|nr:hypothetical protein [Shewanella shenzhenensis]
MLGVLLVVVVVIGLLAIIKLKKGPKKRSASGRIANARKRLTMDDEPDRRFHCVSIEHYGECCEKADEVKGKRFLSKEAPEIPMEECTNPDCQCRYQHYEDRRHNEDERRIDYGVTHDLYGLFGEENRRENRRGRRSDD